MNVYRPSTKQNLINHNFRLCQSAKFLLPQQLGCKISLFRSPEDNRKHHDSSRIFVLLELFEKETATGVSLGPEFPANNSPGHYRGSHETIISCIPIIMEGERNGFNPSIFSKDVIETMCTNDYISSPLASSVKTCLTNTFLLILPMAFFGISSTTFITCGIL